jgi:hypothetical protein
LIHLFLLYAESTARVVAFSPLAETPSMRSSARLQYDIISFG